MSEASSIVELLMEHGIDPAAASQITTDLLAWLNARPNLLAAFLPSVEELRDFQRRIHRLSGEVLNRPNRMLDVYELNRTINGPFGGGQ